MPYLGSEPAQSALVAGDIADNAVTTAKINDDAVTIAKLASGTDGQIITYDASGNPAAVGPGTDGQVLTSTGAGSPPAFEAASAGWEFVEAEAPSSAATITFAHTVEAGYDYMIVCNDMINDADIAIATNNIKIQYGTGATPTFQTSGYVSQHMYSITTVPGSQPHSVTNGIGLMGAAGWGGSSANEFWNVEATILNPGANQRTTTFYRTWAINSDGNEMYDTGAGSRTTADVVTGLRVLTASGAITGDVTLSRRAVA